MLAKAFLTASPGAACVFSLSHHLQSKAHPLNAPEPGLLCRWLARATRIEYPSIQESKQKPKATPTKSHAKFNLSVRQNDMW